MRIAVAGAGYVGLSLAVLLARDDYFRFSATPISWWATPDFKTSRIAPDAAISR